jgi:hypothetical protein
MHVMVQLYRLTCVDMMVLISRYWRAASQKGYLVKGRHVADDRIVDSLNLVLLGTL